MLYIYMIFDILGCSMQLHSIVTYRQQSGELIQNINLAPNKRMPQSERNIAMTGFGGSQIETNYLQMIQKLNCKYNPNITYNTNILIVNKTSTQKYQMAQVLSNQIETVTVDWLIDSSKVNQILDLKKYKIHQILYGVTISILGFQKQKQPKIINKIKENGGSVVDIILSSAMESQNWPDVLVATKHYYKKIETYLPLISIPIVELQWLEESFITKTCKFPKNYSLNFYYLYPESIKVSQKLQRHLDEILAIPIFTLPNYLLNQLQQPFLIHLDRNTISKDLYNVLKPLICLTGGVYIETLNPVLTYILVGDITEEQFIKLSQQAGSVSILRVQWLIDTLLFKNRMSDNDYRVRSFKGAKGGIEIPSTTNSHSFHNSFIHLNRQNSMQSSNRKTISGIETAQVIRKTRVMKSQIFKDLNFFLEPNQRKMTELNNITSKILENGGTVYESPNKKKKNYFVLKDSPKNEQIITHYKKKYSKVEIIPVSLRWINYCIKKSSFIPHNSEGYLIFKPFEFETPLVDFMHMKFQILGVDQILQKRLRELLICLGSSKLTPNKSELTHCLCGSKYNQAEKYKQIRRQNPKVQFLAYEWVIDIVNNNIKTPDRSKYIIRNIEEEIEETDKRTPEKFNEDIKRELVTQQKQSAQS